MITCIFLQAFTVAMAQSTPTVQADTLVIRVGETGKIIFAIPDKKDLETLRHYDFQMLVEDMITKLENDDTTSLKKPSVEYLKDTTTRVNGMVTTDDHEEDDDDNVNDRTVIRVSHRNGTKHSFNVELGLNNYLENGKFPDQSNSMYTTRSWGSWNVALNSIQHTRMGQKTFLEWGGGVSWYNYKFQSARTNVITGSNGVEFAQDIRDLDFRKSKLSVMYLNASVVPMFGFGNKSYKHGFRMGVGPYAGYRIDSYSKLVYKELGEKRVERNHDNFYLNNFRYGIRLQLGFDDTDLFFTYDLNSLFLEGKGPQLHAFSFGVTL
jgi:hypothetical protein